MSRSDDNNLSIRKALCPTKGQLKEEFHTLFELQYVGCVYEGENPETEPSKYQDFLDTLSRMESLNLALQQVNSIKHITIFGNSMTLFEVQMRLDTLKKHILPWVQRAKRERRRAPRYPPRSGEQCHKFPMLFLFSLGR